MYSKIYFYITKTCIWLSESYFYPHNLINKYFDKEGNCTYLF